MSTGSDNIGSLTSIKPLDGMDTWQRFERDIKGYLCMNGFEDLLAVTSAPPENPNTARIAAVAFNAGRNANDAPQHVPALATESSIARWEDKLEKYNLRQSRACGIVISRSGSARKLVEDFRVLSTIFTTLEREYKPKGTGNFAKLTRVFNNIRLGDKGVRDFASELRNAWQEVNDLDPSCQISSAHLIHKFLNELEPHFTGFFSAFYQNNDILPTRDQAGAITKQAITFEEAVYKAELEEIRGKENESVAALLSRATGNGKLNSSSKNPCEHCNRTSHLSRSCWLKFPEKRAEFDKKRADRKEKKKQTRKENTEKEDTVEATANLARFGTEEVIPQFSFMTLQNPDLFKIVRESYALDSGCTQHVGSKKEDFVQLRPLNHRNSKIHGIGGKSCQPTHTGTLRLACNVEGHKVIVLFPNALLVPSLHANLLSVSQLKKAGSSVEFTDNGAMITKSASKITMSLVKGLYLLDLWKGEPAMALASFRLDGPGMQLWHDRLGHLGQSNIERLMQMSTGIKNCKATDCLCKACALGKMNEKPHNGSSRPGEYPLEFVHTDIFGPVKITGYNGARYWCSFIDDKTRIAWIYILKQKLEFPGTLRHFLDTNERPERKCHRLRLDKAGENVSSEVKSLCWERGIHLDYTETAQHQSNGVAERFNRTLEEKIAPTLIRAEIDPKYWPEIAQAIVVIRNRSPVSGKDTTPYEAWFGDVPDCSFLRILGSDCWAMKPTTTSNCNKLIGDKSVPCKLLGFKGTHSYVLLRPDGTILTANNVEIDERRIHHQPLKALIPFEPSSPTGSHHKSSPLDDFSIHGAALRRSQRSHSVPVALRNETEGLAYATEHKPASPQPVAHQSTTVLQPPVDASAAVPQTITRQFDLLQARKKEDKRRLLLLQMERKARRRCQSSSSQPGEGVVTIEPDLPVLDDSDEDYYPVGPSVNESHAIPPITFDQHPVLRTPRRTRNTLPARFALHASSEEPNPCVAFARQEVFALLTSAIQEAYEPKTLRQARDDPSWESWRKAMKEEYESLVVNTTWSLILPPKGRRVLSGKWVYKLKRGPDGSVVRYKARWVVRGFEQQEGIDYQETFASVVKPMSYKAIFAIAAALDLELEQMDVKTAFLYGDIEEEVYVEQPPEFEDGSPRVCKLSKALYGLKQSPRIWYYTLADFLKTLGFQPLASDLGVFAKGHTYIAVYVDDLLIAGPSSSEIAELKKSLNKRFEMVDLGACTFYLGMSITRNRCERTLHLSQKGYVEKVLKEFDMHTAKPNATPMETAKFEETPKNFEASKADRTWYAKAIGSLMYAMLGTRPDISFAVSCCSRYLANPMEQHIKAVKRIMRYLGGSIDLSIVYRGELDSLIGYTDSDWAGDQDTRRSHSGYVFNVGSGAISWSSKRQPTVALSSTEAEYMGQTQATKEAIWLRRLLKELHAQDSIAATTIFGDNQGAIALAKNPQFHPRSKHIAIQHHFVRDVEMG